MVCHQLLMHDDACKVEIAMLSLELTSTLQNYSASYWVLCLKSFLKLSASAKSWTNFSLLGIISLKLCDASKKHLALKNFWHNQKKTLLKSFDRQGSGRRGSFPLITEVVA